MAVCNNCNNANRLWLGCFSSCDSTIAYDFTSDETGTHTINYLFGGAVNTYSFSATSGVPFNVDNIFNESGIVFFEIIKPSGDPLDMGGFAEELTCFYFQNKVGFSLD